jgi:N-acetyl-anhydromuramyl-L-alanine amidase AmpD
MHVLWRIARLFLLMVGLALLFTGCRRPSRLAAPLTVPAVTDPQATQVPVFDAERLRLTELYSATHYGIRSYHLEQPQMIVVHYTAIPTLKESQRFFKPSHLDPSSRADIAGGGELNVAAHYLVDRNGALYQLAPEDILCRHTIGFNNRAIGIENVAANAGSLTERQAQATAGLISRIVKRHPGIRYLIGHHEYRNRQLPHYQLFQELDPTYRFTDKIDPGPQFMTRVRHLLKTRYRLTLQD